MTDDEFLAAFEACAFARGGWTHESHVRMAWLYLSRLPFAEALESGLSGGLGGRFVSSGSVIVDAQPPSTSLTITA